MKNIISKNKSEFDMDRKQFLKTAGSTALFAFLGITLNSCGVTNSNDEMPEDDDDDEIVAVTVSGNTVTLNLDANSLSSLKSEGGWMVISQGSVIVVNIDGSRIRAFTDVCPHQSCRTNWQYNNQRFICTCHNSIFENTGQFVSGPAGRDLNEFSVSRNGNIVVITK